MLHPPLFLTAILSTFFLAMITTAAAERSEKATFVLDGKNYDLDFVLCYQEPDDSVRIALGDIDARDEFPSIGIWLKPDQPDAKRPQVFSADFYRTDPRLKWRFESGDFRLTSDGFEASGVMNGVVVDEAADRFMTPLGEDKDREFKLEVTCSNTPKPQAVEAIIQVDANDDSNRRELTQEDVLNTVHQKGAALNKMCRDAGNTESICVCAISALKKQIGGAAVADFDRLIHGLHENQDQGMAGREAWDAAVASEATRRDQSADEILATGRAMGEAFESTTNACKG